MLLVIGTFPEEADEASRREAGSASPTSAGWRSMTNCLPPAREQRRRRSP